MKKYKGIISFILICGFAIPAFTQSSVITSLIPPYPGDASKFLNGTGQFSTPSGSGGGTAGTVINSVASAGLLAVDGSKTNGIVATEAHVTNALGRAISGTGPLLATSAGVLKAGDTMTGSLTISPGADTSGLAITNYSKTTSNSIPMLDISGTWNNGTGTNTAVKLNVTDTASGASSLLMDLQVGGASKVNANKLGQVFGTDVSNTGPAFGFTDDPDTGIGNYAANTLGLVLGGGTWATWTSSQLLLDSGMSLAWDDGGSLASGSDLFIRRDAANTLALRNGANAQAFNVYNTYTDASNYELARFTWSGNIFYIGPNSAGSGTARNMSLRVRGSASLNLDTADTTRWTVNSSGHLIAGADNTYDIGASGATRPRNVYVGSALVAGTSLNCSTGVIMNGGASSYLQFVGVGVITPPSDGVLTLKNGAQTDFNRLQFGGTTDSFPSIKRNSTALESRLADDSNYAPFNAPWQQSGYTKVCTSATSNAVFYVSVPNTNMVGGSVFYTVNATDGTDSQQITGETKFGAVGKSTTVTANVTDVQNTSTVSAGTLTAVVTANVSTNNVLAIMFTPTTSLTTTNLTVRWRITTPSAYTINPL